MTTKTVLSYPPDVVEVSVSGAPGPPGPPGKQGPPGPPGSGGGGPPQYIHIQSMLSNEWQVEHFLYKHPDVTCEDAAGTVMYGTVTYVDDNHLTIKFAITVTGRANCI